MNQNQLFQLAIYSIVPYIVKNLLKEFPTHNFRSNLGKMLMSLSRPVMMILMAIPEQYVMMTYYPEMSLIKRLSVSIAMYLIHFAWNGMVMKPKHSYNELVWILGTACYASNVLGVDRETTIALVAADSVMTLALRGLA
jgi:hypothetical protein